VTRSPASPGGLITSAATLVEGTHPRTGTLRAAWNAGCYKAMLQTSSRKPATHAFYKACGFSPDTKTAYLARPS
jgi:hypothetical protein